MYLYKESCLAERNAFCNMTVLVAEEKNSLLTWWDFRTTIKKRGYVLCEKARKSKCRDRSVVALTLSFFPPGITP